MAIVLSTKLQNDAADAFAALFANGRIHIYSGSRPQAGDNALTGTLLGIVTENGLPFTPGSTTNGLNFDAAVNGVVTKAAAETWQFAGLANGIAGYFVLLPNSADDGTVDSGKTHRRYIGTIGTSNADLIMSNPQVVLNAVKTVDEFSLAIPTQYK